MKLEMRRCHGHALKEVLMNKGMEIEVTRFMNEMLEGKVSRVGQRMLM